MTLLDNKVLNFKVNFFYLKWFLVRDWSKISKPGTFCFEEEDPDDEDAVSSNSDAERRRSACIKSGETSDRSTTAGESSPIRKESDVNFAAEEVSNTTNSSNLNNTDVIVAKSCFVEDEH